MLVFNLSSSKAKYKLRFIFFVLQDIYKCNIYTYIKLERILNVLG